MDYFLNPRMPSLLQVFQPYSLLLGILGMVLGIAMGFDQITKEKESGSLKSVLSAPVYRDSLINGKTIGSMACLAAAVGIMFLVTIAIMLFYGVVPSLDDLVRIGLFFIASILYCTAFFAIAMLTSAVSRSSAMAVILAIGIVFALLIISFASSIASFFIADSMLGPAPAPEYTPVTPVYTIGTGELNSTVPVATPTSNPTSDYYNKKGKLQMQISDVLNIISPAYDYMGIGSMYPGIAQALLSREKPTDYYTALYVPYSRPTQVSLLDSLSYAWVKALALIVETLLAFALSYVLFMRADVR
jgi:ABC-2 type transport system permease protein